MIPPYLACRVEPIDTSHHLEFELCRQLVLTLESMRSEKNLLNILPIVYVEALASCTPAGTRNKETGPVTRSVDQDIWVGKPVETWLLGWGSMKSPFAKCEARKAREKDGNRMTSQWFYVTRIPGGSAFSDNRIISVIKVINEITYYKHKMKSGQQQGNYSTAAGV